MTQFLDLELHHSLGAYRHARDCLRSLEKQLEDDEHVTGQTDGRFLIDLVGIMRRYNHELDVNHDASGDPPRHPAPTELPLSRPAALRDEDPVIADSTSRHALTWVTAYYRAAILALQQADEIDMDTRQGSDTDLFMRAIMVNRADLDGNSLSDDRDGRRRTARNERYTARLKDALSSGISPVVLLDSATTDDGLHEAADAAPEAVIHTIMASHLEATHREPLAPFVIKALVDAHLCLHTAEAHWSVPLGQALKRDETDEAARQLLRRSIALNTFAWTVARTAPWIFAETDDERSYMVRFYPRAWRNNMPMVAMWSSAQVSLLALLRRAFAYTLLGDTQAAYNDYHKLRRTIRATLRRLRHTSVHVNGAIEFLDGLDALADHHVGGLYWASRDHGSALVHFERAHRRMDRLKRESQHMVITNSRWFVQLQLGLGKASYELGRHKAALGWYLRAWRSLLELVADDTSGVVYSDALDSAIVWIDRVVDDPELHKRDVIEHLTPVVQQIAAMLVWKRFTSLASEIVLRLGHLLYMLHLDDEPVDAPAHVPADLAPPPGGLAMLCIRRAAQLDADSLPARSGVLKLLIRGANLPLSPSLREILEQNARRASAIQNQWSGTAGSVEGVSRAVEYMLLQELRFAPESSDERVQLSRALLLSLLTHTDSIEARRSQVHGYLTRPASDDAIDRPENAPAMEFVCLRRYSSAFPILPRPNGFRSHGGGYFVRCHPGGEGTRSLGVAIDPGTSYVECLYRAGLSIADIDVLIVTHDHVDHASSMEPLLALRHEMHQLGAVQRPLVIIGNSSVGKRLEPLRVYQSGVKFRHFTRHRRQIDAFLTREVRALIQGSPRDTTLTLTPLSSELSRGKGHGDIAGHPAFGFVLALTSGSRSSSVAFTGDLPEVPSGHTWPGPGWAAAFDANVLVAHMSTAPLSELRVMAQIGTLAEADPTEHGRLEADAAWINKSGQRDGIAARLAYAHWLQYGDGQMLPPVGGAEQFAEWQRPSSHPYLNGLVDIAKTYAERQVHGGGLLVVGELSEELGSFRGKIAEQISGRVFKGTTCQAQTGDLGLRVLLCADRVTDPVRIACSTCQLDNDLIPAERFHPPRDIAEVCVKGENESMFYNCREHDPRSPRTDPIFVEKLERYDIFGR